MVRDLLERPVRDLRISVTDKCNFRCSYCMPEEIYGFEYKFLPKSQILTFEEIIRLTKLYVKLGVRKVRLTGGEPLLRQQIEQLVAQLSAIEGIDDIALTTNGYLLEGKAALLHNAGLKRITVSIDTLNPLHFEKIAGRRLQLQKVIRGIVTATDVGYDSIKLNTVVQRNVNEDEVVALAEFARSNGLIIRFIEFMDVGNLNKWQLEKVVTAESIIKTVTAVFPAVPVEKGYPGEVANRFRYLDGKGEFGVIASVTRPFCGGCTRVRLSADGHVYTCLFGKTGVDVLGPLRSGAADNELLSIITTNWRGRRDRYSELRSEHTSGSSREKKIEMYQIGG